MMLDIKPGSVLISTTSGRGHSIDEIAERAVDRIISIAETAPEPIKIQANHFRERMLSVMKFYMRAAVRSDRTTLQNMLRNSGYEDLADSIGDL